MNRKSWALILALVGAIGAYGAWWAALARSVEKGLAEWAETRRAAGWTVEFGDVETEGFPFRLIVSATNPKIAAEGWSWSAPKARGVVKPWGLGHVIATVEGRQEISLAVPEGIARFSVDAERWLGSFRHKAGVLHRADIEATKPTIESPALAGAYKAEKIEAHYRKNAGEAEDRPAQSADLAFDIAGAALPEAVGGPLGSGIASIVLRTRLLGEWGGSRAGLAQWREEGGTLEVESFKIVWGPLDATLNATLALDKNWRPLGAGTLRARGYERTIDAVEKAKLMRPVEAQMLRLALATQAKRDGDPRAFVDLPVTAQDGRLFVGPVPVLHLQPIFAPTN